MTKLKIIYFGSPYYSVPLLKKIISLGHQVPLVISQGSKKTRRGKIVHTPIYEFCKKNKLILFEDCCEAHGASINRKVVGSFGEISAFSFFVAHAHLATQLRSRYQTDRTTESEGDNRPDTLGLSLIHI